MCPLAQKGKHMLVHWVYYPDSYDCWVPASEVGGAPEPTAELPKKWMVSSVKGNLSIRALRGFLLP